MEFLSFLAVLVLANVLIIGIVAFIYTLKLRLNKKNENVEVKTVEKKSIDSSIEILKLEFGYAKESNLKAESDRLTIVNIYISLYSISIPLAIGFLQLDNNTASVVTYVLLFFMSLLGVIFVIKLVRLRQAWYGSAMVMNKIKDYFKNLDEELNQFLIWSAETMPKPSKFKTISYLSAILISLMGASTIFVGLYLVTSNLLFTFLIALLYLSILLALYHFMLEYNK